MINDDRVKLEQFIVDLYRKCQDEPYIQHIMHPPILDQIKCNALEIGACTGRTTCYFAGVCLQYGKEVYAIDPYCGAQQGTEEKLRIFRDWTSEYPNITLHRISSLSPEARKVMEDFDYGYAFVDGLHTGDAAYRDLVNVHETISYPGLVLLDDVNETCVMKAMQRTIAEGKYYWIRKPPIHLPYPKNRTSEYLFAL